VVSHFRQADIEAGGQGAPLAPLLHRHLFYSPDEHRAVLNLGGIANLTFLDPGGSVSGFDCGPANCLLDLWIRSDRGADFDDGGSWAASGSVDTGLLDDMLSDPYFLRPAPKSTGLEYFNAGWLAAFLQRHTAAPEDVQATLAELTARTVADAVASQSKATGTPVQRLLVCGGGAHNTYLMNRFSKLMPAIAVESTRHYGMHPDWVEAVLFAWLARERLLDRPQDTRLVTGASQPVHLGRVHPRSDIKPQGA
jgi:anhydro-N-acetylmuramic acid kinase